MAIYASDISFHNSSDVHPVQEIIQSETNPHPSENQASGNRILPPCAGYPNRDHPALNQYTVRHNLPMKANHVIAALLAIAGLMVVTYAQTRYWTTQLLAANAQKTIIRIIEKDGLYAEKYPERLPSHVTHAMHSIGGRYNWHNEGYSHTVYGVAIIVLGCAVARTRKKEKRGLT